MNTHDTDFYTWTQEQAALLRAGRLSDLDIAGLLEEVEDMGRSERRALESRLAVLLMHLLKWKYQPNRRGRSWELTIKAQRYEVKKEIRDNPGLKPSIPIMMTDAYELARLKTEKETRLLESTFPTECPWDFNQVIDADFWPE
jgi:hypothetical protein